MSSVPIKKNTAVKIAFPILDADGDPVGGAAGLDSEYSLDGGNFADCTNEATNITSGGANTGIYYLDLVAAETNGDLVAIQVKTSTAGAKTTVLVFHTAGQTFDEMDTVADAIKAKTDNLPADPADDSDLDTAIAALSTKIDAVDDYVDTEVAAIKAVTDTLSLAAIADAVWDENLQLADHNAANSGGRFLRRLYETIVTSVDGAQGGAAGSITLSATESAVNDYYKGQTIAVYSGTGAGQARACYAYDGGTKVASIRPNWATAPDITSDYAILNVGSAVIASLEDAAVDQFFNEVVDANNPANANSLREVVNVMSAALAGKSNGGGTNTIKFRDLGDTKDRITATVDVSGNRTAVTDDGT